MQTSSTVSEALEAAFAHRGLGAVAVDENLRVRAVGANAREMLWPIRVEVGGDFAEHVAGATERDPKSVRERLQNLGSMTVAWGESAPRDYELRYSEALGCVLVEDVSTERWRQAELLALQRALATQLDPKEIGRRIHDLRNVLTVLALDLGGGGSSGSGQVLIDEAVAMTRQLLDTTDAVAWPESTFDYAVTGMRPMLAACAGRATLNVSSGCENRPLPMGRSELRSMLTNLVVNAQRAEAKSITVSCREEETGGQTTLSGMRLPPGLYMAIEVSDDGRGMSPDIRARAFEPSFTTHPQGTGQGLSDVARLVNQARGRLVVDSELGKGTSIKVYFPLERRDAR